MNHSDEEIKFINSAFEETKEAAFEMAQIGFIQGRKYEIAVRTDDAGDIPHFHMWDYNSRGSEFHTCIEINRNRYFHHEGKKDVLNAALRKELVSFLSSKHKRGMTNWEYIVQMWNDNNSKMQIDETLPMPDYSTIELNC